MKCTKCQRENSDVARFCTDCGARLATGPVDFRTAGPAQFGSTGTPSTRRGSNLKLWLIGLGTVLAVAVVGVFIWLLNQPEGGVKFANDMDGYALEYLETHDLLNRTESLVAYYDATISLNGTEAAILTTERIGYHNHGRTQWIGLTEISDVTHLSP